MLLRIEAPHFVAGAVLDKGVVITAAPYYFLYGRKDRIVDIRILPKEAVVSDEEFIEHYIKPLEEIVQSLPWPKKYYEQRMKLFESTNERSV